MRLPRIKICGVNDAGFALAACTRADYLGFIFAPASPRRVDEAAAAAIVGAVRARAPRVRCAGVFTGGSVAEIAAIGRRLALDTVQLHGDFAAPDVARLRAGGFEVWRLDTGAEPRGEDALLLDGSAPGMAGGTGKTADWPRARALAAAGRRIVLAGGLGAGNLAAAAGTGAAVLDLNSSLETAPGRKSLRLLEELFAEIARLEALPEPASRRV